MKSSQRQRAPNPEPYNFALNASSFKLFFTEQLSECVVEKNGVNMCTCFSQLLKCSNIIVLFWFFVENRTQQKSRY